MKRKLTSLLLALVMVLGLAVSANAADTVSFPDVKSHWAQSAIERWAGSGVVKGNDAGNFMPEDSIRRGDFALMLYRMMGYAVPKDGNPFADLSEKDYYAQAVLAANHVGVLRGDGTTVRAAASITREEAAVLMARVLNLSGSSKPSAEFRDVGQISPWALDAVNAMSAEGYFKGDTNGMFRPASPITRAEVATLLDRAFAVYVDSQDAYSKDTNGNVLVTKPGAMLKNMKITGDLIIAEGVGDGDVTLDSVTVTGRMLVRGGGSNSIHIKGDSSIANVVIARQDGKVRIAVEGDAVVSVIVIDDGSDSVKIDGKVATVNVAAPEVKVEITGTVQTVQVAETAVASVVTVGAAAKVESLTTAAPKGEIIVVGAITKVETAPTATETAVKAKKGANITTVVAAGAGTQVSGDGKVANVEAKGDNVAVDTGNTKVTADPDVKGTTAGDKPVGGGESRTTPPSTGSTVPTTTTYTMGLSLQKDSENAIIVSKSGYSESAKAYDGVVKNMYTEREIQVTNAILEFMRKLKTEGMATCADETITAESSILTLTQKGRDALAKLVEKYNTLKTALTTASAIDHEDVASVAALKEFLNAIDPNRMVDNSNQLKTAKAYYDTFLKNALDKAYAAIQGIKPAEGKEDALVKYLAENVMDAMSSNNSTAKVYKGFGSSASALSQEDVELMIKAARTADLTLAQWISICNVTKIEVVRTVNGPSLNGRYTVVIELTKQVS